jgi:hypothetical protein
MDDVIQWFISVSVELRPDWVTLVPAPEKPASWKQETYEAKLDELRQKQLANLSEHFAAARIVSVFIARNDNSDDVETMTPNTFVNTIGSSIGIYGVDTLDTLRHIAWTVMKDHPDTQLPIWWKWSSADAKVYDMATMLGSKTMKYTRSDICKFLSIKDTADASQVPLVLKTLARRMGILRS